MRRLCLPLVLILVAAASAASVAAADPPAKQPIMFDAVYGDNSTLTLFKSAPRFRYLPDGDHLLRSERGQLQTFHIATGNLAPLYDTTKLAAALETIPGIDAKTARRLAATRSPQFSPAYDAVLLKHDGDLFYARLDGSFAARLTKALGAEELATFSPDGKTVAYVRGGDLYAVDVDTQTERRFTDDGSDTILNGKADWVYWEEVFQRRSRTFWFSTGATHIAFIRFDDTPVHEFVIADNSNIRQKLKTTRYPQAGTPNPLVEVGIADVSDGRVRWIDLSAYPPEDRLVVRVGWWGESQTVVLYVQNRTQTWLDLLVLPPETDKPQRLLRETTTAWVNDPGPPQFLADGSFLLASERTGWRHLYRFAPNGNCLGPITAGPWEVRGVKHVDEAGGFIYFMGTKDAVGEDHLYRVPLAGGEPVRLTAAAASHNITFAPNGNSYIDTYSSRETPPRIDLYSPGGERLRPLHTTEIPELEQYQFGQSEAITIPAGDGETLDATILKPHDFDPAKTYPVWFQVYGGPHYPTLRNRWSKPHHLFDEVLASSGIVVLRVDPRSASGRSAASAWRAYRQLGVAELRDLEAAVDWLKSQPWADRERVGISGHSYGGFLTAFALTHSRSFAAGIAGAPVTDWRLYDTIYTERYMDTPEANPEGYDATSVVAAAENLHGRLLLIHGLLDDNVHVQNTMQLVSALQKADREFDLMIYPNAKHGIHGAHFARTKYDFILKTMRPDDGASPLAQ